MNLPGVSRPAGAPEERIQAARRPLHEGVGALARARLTRCTHLDQIRRAEPRTPEGCEECLESGDRWVHLRLCLTCGHVGCCDSSPNRHATAHHQQTGHPLIRSFEPTEDWAWCYPDGVPLKGSTIQAALENARDGRDGVGGGRREVD